MGNTGSSATNTSTVNMSQTTSVVSNYLSSISQSASADVTNINDLTMVIGKIGDGCDIDASQSINSKAKVIGQLSSKNTQDIRDKIKADLDNQIQQAAAAQTGAFATGSSSTNNVSNYTSSVNTTIDSNLTDEKQQNIFAKVFNKNQKTITIGECSASGFNQAKLNASQNITSDLVAQAMIDSVSSQIQSLDAQSTQSNSGSQTGTAKTTGPIQDLFDGISNLLENLLGMELIGPFLLICCCCLCLCICAAIGMHASEGSGGSPSPP